MRILYGVCGLGGGHAGRAIPIIRRLVAAGHEVVIVASRPEGSTAPRMLAEQTGLPVRECPFLPVRSTPDGTGLLDPVPLADPMVIDDVGRHDAPTGGTIDLVVSDYEPFVGAWASAHRVPLTTLDQQSKFLHGRWPLLDGRACDDERQRLLGFFPHARRIALSFFDPADVPGWTSASSPEADRSLGDGAEGPFSVHVILPTRVHATDERPIAVGAYLSTQLPVRRIPRLHPSWERLAGTGPIEARLSRLTHVVCGAGHSLLSEAIAHGVRVLVIPNDLYEQRLNAMMVERGGHGLALADDDAGATVRRWLAMRPATIGTGFDSDRIVRILLADERL